MEQLGDGIYHSQNLNAILVDCQNLRLSEMAQLDQLFGRVKLFSLKSVRRPYVLVNIQGTKIDRAVSEYYSRQVLSLLLEYVAGISFYNANATHSLVGLARRVAPSRYQEKISVFPGLTEAVEGLCDAQGLPEVVLPQAMPERMNFLALAI